MLNTRQSRRHATAISNNGPSHPTRTLEKWTILESQQQDQTSTIQRQIWSLSEKNDRMTVSHRPAARCIQEVHSKKRENKELRVLIEKVRVTSDRQFNLMIPDVQREMQSLKDQVGVLASQTPAETLGSWSRRK